MVHPARTPFPKMFREIPLFRDLPEASVSKIQERCNWRRYDAGEVIVDHLDRTDDVFFIAEGTARASIYSCDGKAVTFSDLSSGNMFGELAAIDGAKRSASIEARTACTVVSMGAAAFREVLRSEPEVATRLFRELVARIRTLTTRVYEFSALDVANRTRAELLRLARLAPPAGNTAVIAPAPTHADIASRISTHREAVTRELNRLAKMKLIERKSGSLIVKDLERLAELVHDITGE